MLVHDNTLISLDLIEKDFVCNLSACKGACCVEGESGAPLDEGEIKIIADNINKIKPYMTSQALELLDEKGFWEKDTDGDLVTNCLDGKACIFAITEGDVYKCSIEKAYNAGDINYKKPISCHLYPVRLAKVGEYQALNYSKWEVCDPACKLGESLKVPVFKFLKEALVRKFGDSWFEGLEEIAGEYLSHNS